MEITLSKFGNVIATDEKSQEIYKKVHDAIKSGKSVTINAAGVTISTKSSIVIFGKLYKEFKEKFGQMIKFINASELFMFSVNEGISTEMEGV